MSKIEVETDRKLLQQEMVPALNEPVENNVVVPEGKKLHHHLHKEMELFASRPSLLSSEASANSYRGLLNLMIIILFTTNFRLVVENMMKHGFLLNFTKYYVEEWYRWPAVVIGVVLCTFVLMAYVLELLTAAQKFEEKTCDRLIIANIVCAVVIPSVLVWVIKPNPASGLVVMFYVVVFGMKLVSYAYTNHTLRWDARTNKVENGWPQNLKLRNLIYFILIPTLCYRLEYPRSPSIRWGFLFRRIIEGIFLSVLILVIVEQYIVPLVHSSFRPSQGFEILLFTERLLKLSVPNLYVWLMGFYVFFHIYLNIMAEITRYGDRLFYRDWWNSTSLAYYWRTWNIPVHAWMLVHVYAPMTQRGYSKAAAYFACFFVSAAFHELVIAVPFQLLKMWSFLGIMAQIPLIIVTSSLRGNQLGNVIFWFSIVLGQPFLVLMMYRAWYEKNYGANIEPVELVLL